MPRSRTGRHAVIVTLYRLFSLLKPQEGLGMAGASVLPAAHPYEKPLTRAIHRERIVYVCSGMDVLAPLLRTCAAHYP